MTVLGYIEGSFYVRRTEDARERHVPNIYRCMRTWVTALYTVRGVGSGSRDADVWRTNVTSRIGGSKYR